MKSLDLTFPSPAANLACDEALLDFFEERGGDGVLRFWEPRNYFVVVGYANEVAKEVNVTACDAEEIPIHRRCSGGGTVLQGPGCLNYSLIAPITEGGPLHSITSANRFIMERNRAALGLAFKVQNSRIEVAGHTDLILAPPSSGLSAIALVTAEALAKEDRPLGASKRSEDGSTLNPPLKFSGNAQRRRKHFLLFHGTFLLNFDILQIEKYLRMPSKEPAYRKTRSHKDFLTNLNLPAEEVKHALSKAWSATQPLETVPQDAIALLARDKYVTKEWNFRF